MHFSIPDTQELYADATGTTYTGYNIYINGAYHCCLRYKQLHALHEQLRRRCSAVAIALPPFPPKRLLPLTATQLEVRRAALEHYLQLVGQQQQQQQDARVTRFEHFQSFLLVAQLETAAAEADGDPTVTDFGGAGGEVSLEVVLMNGYQLQVACRVSDNASALLRQVGARLQLPTHLLRYFGLFLLRKEPKDTLVLLRRLLDFEAPFLSRLYARPCQIALRKCYWSPALDLRLMQEPIALNLLFIQTLCDVEREWIIAPPEVLQQLRSLQEHGLKREYLEMARQLPLYGCLQFTAALVDYPERETEALISIGNSELSMRTAKGAKIYETKFRVTRMRCWRVTAALHQSSSSSSPESEELPNAAQLPQLSFEYLMSKQTLRWISISSAQAMLMSVCLQSMVDELLTRQQEEEKEAVAASADKQTAPLAYVSRNGRNTTTTTTPSSSSSTHSFATQEQQQQSQLGRSSSSTTSTPTSSTSTSTTSATSSSTSTSPTAPVKFLAQRSRPKQNSKISANSYAAVFFRNNAQESAESSVHNEAFEGIGDDDL